MNKKVPIIIICVLMFIIILLLIVFKDRVNDDKNVSETSYLVIGDDSVWMYDHKWQKASYNNVPPNYQCIWDSIPQKLPKCNRLRENHRAAAVFFV